MIVNATFVKKTIKPTVTNCKLLQQVCERWFNKTIVEHNMDLFTEINNCDMWDYLTDSMGLPTLINVYKGDEVVTVIGVKS